MRDAFRSVPTAFLFPAVTLLCSHRPSSNSPFRPRANRARLAQVKQEFQRKPEIYNEFLDIMKNFKAQTIDTPGVIKKVSELFRGYRKLILGFNTFLPEGHKINDEDIERSEAEFRAAEEEARAREMAAQQALSGQGRGPGGGPGEPGGNPAAGGPAPQHQEFDHAISYVTNIKQRFSKEPDTYKAFLDILHAYQKDQAKPKEQQKGIQEVLDKVSKLFADHPDLLKEFTHFLPDAVQGQAKERHDRAAQEAIERKRR